MPRFCGVFVLYELMWWKQWNILFNDGGYSRAFAFKINGYYFGLKPEKSYSFCKPSAKADGNE